MGGLDGPVEKDDACEKEAGTSADLEDQDLDVVGGIDEVRGSGYESDGLTISEIRRQKRVAKKSVPEGVIDISHLPQCGFLCFQHLSPTFLLEFFCWPVIEFY